MPKRRSVEKADSESVLAHATLKLLGKEDWPQLTLAAVARAARVSVPDALALAPSKIALPGLVLRLFCREAAQRHTAGSDSGSPRERLFDVTMTWFDVQQPHAPALKKFYRALQRDPATLLAMRGDVLQVSGELLALAEADFGFSARIQSAAFAGVLARAVRTWCDDDTEMGKTMAQLEGDLRRVERFLWPKPAKPQSRKSRRT
jgi:ubiquinone biosynthesis protein COQ9